MKPAQSKSNVKLHFRKRFFSTLRNIMQFINCGVTCASSLHNYGSFYLFFADICSEALSDPWISPNPLSFFTTEKDYAQRIMSLFRQLLFHHCFRSHQGSVHLTQVNMLVYLSPTF